MCPDLNISLLLPNEPGFKPSIDFDVTIGNAQSMSESEVIRLAKSIHPSCSNELLLANIDCPTDEPDTQSSINSPDPCRRFTNVCLGGTFDRFHNGHKILLSTAALTCNQRLTVGITASHILGRKQLAPLIFSFDRRSRDVHLFCSRIGWPHSQLRLVELIDPYGPPATEANFEAIVASKESRGNCEKLNQVRASNNLQPLHIEEIDFVPSFCNIQSMSTIQLPDSVSESKLSASTRRYASLGRLLRPPHPVDQWDALPGRPYVIGLTGSSGSGKTATARRLAKVACSDRLKVIDCDQLGHAIYRPGTECYTRILQEFGQSIALPDPPYLIDRKKLGQLVFSNPQQLTKLNSIVWPSMLTDICDSVAGIGATSKIGPRPVVVLDAAVLLVAGWDAICHEIWSTLVPRDEALNRVVQRGSHTPDQANQRLDAQSEALAKIFGPTDWWSPGQLEGSQGPVARSHVLLCTAWDERYSLDQVQRAYKALVDRL